MENFKCVVAFVASACFLFAQGGCSDARRQAEEYWHTGMERLNENDLSEAAACFQKSTELKPDFAPSYAGLGETSLRERDYARAEKYFTEALDLDSRIVSAIAQ